MATADAARNLDTAPGRQTVRKGRHQRNEATTAVQLLPGCVASLDGKERSFRERSKYLPSAAVIRALSRASSMSMLGPGPNGFSAHNAKKFRSAVSSSLVATAAVPTGVYFDGTEIVSVTHHPSQSAYDACQMSTPVDLPDGKPMPQPPRFAAEVCPGDRTGGVGRFMYIDGQKQELHRDDDDDVAVAVVVPVVDEVDYTSSTSTEAGTSPTGKSSSSNRRRRRHVSEANKKASEQPTKRIKTDHKRTKGLSKEERAFVEAAMALSESGAPPRPPTTQPVATVTPSTSPKSLMQALPPPPFFLAASELKLEE